MKILFFSSYFYPYISGLTVYPFKILTYLAKNHKITVLTFNHKENKYKIETIDGLNVIRMPYLFKIYKGFISPQSIFFFLKYLKDSDLIIINLPNIEGFILTILSKCFRKKIVSILHCFLGYYKNLSLKIIIFLTNTITAIQLFLSDQIVYSTKDYIDTFPISGLIKNKIKICFPPIHKLPISQPKLQQFLKLKKNHIWLGYTGRISIEKGIEYLIKAMANLLAKGGFVSGGKSQILNLKILFAGPYAKEVVGENKYFLKIKKMLDENKIKYKFLGNLKENQLGAFYKAIDVLVLPSVNSTEAFGMVQAEAMLSGTPVIASNLPGVRIPIKLTKMGLIVEPKNIDQLSQAIKNILENKNKFTNKKLIKNAQKIFDIKNVYKFWDKLLNLNNKIKIYAYEKN